MKNDNKRENAGENRPDESGRRAFAFFSNSECEYFPCHQTADPDNFNCLFCYCPLYLFGERCKGNFTYTKKGIKNCSACTIPHKKENYDYIVDRFIKLSEEDRIKANGNSVNFMKTDPRAVVPTYGSESAAGADLYACLDSEVEIVPGETAMIHTGIALEIPDGYAGLVCARSGLASRKGLAPANKVGVIDSDYRGEIIVPLHNHGQSPVTIAPGERIAQILLTPIMTARFTETDALNKTERGTSGFGSTGSR